MKIQSIHLQNFKRFTDLKIQNIPAIAKLVVLLGPNGCGKSSLFDAFHYKSYEYRQMCVASSDGQKVYQRLAAALKADRDVLLSFRNVTALTAAFLNAAIGQLYGIFNEKHIQNLLKVEDVEQNDLALLKRVVDNAKLYFKDPQRFNPSSPRNHGR